MNGEIFTGKLFGGLITEDHLKWYHACAILDNKGEIKIVTPEHQQITGFSPKEIIGTKLIDRINPDDIHRIHEQHKHMIKSGEAVECKFEIKYKDGLYYTVRSLVIPQFSSDGDFVGSVMLGRKRNEDFNYVNIADYRKTHILSPLPFVI